MKLSLTKPWMPKITLPTYCTSMTLLAKCCLSLTCMLQLQKLIYIVCPRPCLLSCQSVAHRLSGLKATWDTSFQKSVLFFNDKSKHRRECIWHDFKLQKALLWVCTPVVLEWEGRAQDGWIPCKKYTCSSFALVWLPARLVSLHSMPPSDIFCWRLFSLSSPGRCSSHPPFSSLTPPGHT